MGPPGDGAWAAGLSDAITKGLDWFDTHVKDELTEQLIDPASAELELSFRPRPRDRVAVRHDCRDALCLCEHGRAGSGPAGVRSANARRLSWHDERICLQACHRADERVGSSAGLKGYECMTRACGRSSHVFKVALCMCTVLLSCR